MFKKVYVLGIFYKQNQTNQPTSVAVNQVFARPGQEESQRRHTVIIATDRQ